MSELLATASFGLKVWILSRKDQPLWLFFYVGAMMVSMALEWPVKWQFGADSQAYFWTWTCCTVLVLLFVGVAVWEHIRLARYRLRALAIASLVAFLPARMSYLSDPGTSRLVMAEGFLLLLAGLLVGLSANRSPRPDISVVLSVLWIAQSTFDWGWILHWPRWNAASWQVGPFLGLAAFGTIAWCLRRKQNYGYAR